ncbi:uncharacterized protein BO88DRAFT_155269 [Aspergillus vadensis CBS 113365]|uniref:Uncharacterized protein n=1 Tax=Aspergillus vadensis (strain CBS 113365 / IMI 142717 / IBT 24658) TaxID=1448311 RepID=A0A319AZN4_ASPVC|nr:hypothetical protein BO88DRAFT_155269 [Aspergillus vadensis CBS 113365]PYH64881.1 hypothetical protein BO88DRAFT_155269 [Aspergillus vadensis CBS 113365]
MGTGGSTLAENRVGTETVTANHQAVAPSPNYDGQGHFSLSLSVSLSLSSDCLLGLLFCLFLLPLSTHPLLHFPPFSLLSLIFSVWLSSSFSLAFTPFPSLPFHTSFGSVNSTNLLVSSHPVESILSSPPSVGFPDDTPFQ